MVDFIVEFYNVPEEEEVLMKKVWIAYVDGSSTREYSGAWVILKRPYGEECEVAIQLQFTTMNNEAEYEAMITGMNIAREMGLKNLEVKSGSQVVVKHVKGEYVARGEKMKKYLETVKEIMGLFDQITFTKVPREENSVADALA